MGYISERDALEAANARLKGERDTLRAALVPFTQLQTDSRGNWQRNDALVVSALRALGI